MLRISGKLLVFKIGYTLDQKILIKCICTAKILQHLVKYCIKSTCVSNADVFIKRGLDSNFFKIKNIFKKNLINQNSVGNELIKIPVR